MDFWQPPLWVLIVFFYYNSTTISPKETVIEMLQELIMLYNRYHSNLCRIHGINRMDHSNNLVKHMFPYT